MALRCTETASRLSMVNAAVQLAACDDVTATSSRRGDFVRCLSAAVAARVAAVQSSPCRAASRGGTATDDPARGRSQDHRDDRGGGGDGGEQQRRGRSSDASDASSASHTPRMYDHQV